MKIINVFIFHCPGEEVVHIASNYEKTECYYYFPKLFG